jgi:hypothetical protein
MKHTVEFIKFHKAICVVDKFGYGKQLLQQVDERVREGLPPLEKAAKVSIIELRQKILEQTKTGDVESNYRRSWLQSDLMETYFLLRRMWFFGPKQSLSWLKANDRIAFNLFSNAYSKPESYEALKALTQHIISV